MRYNTTDVIMQKKGKMFMETLKNNVDEIVNHFNYMVVRAVPKTTLSIILLLTIIL